MAKGKAAATVAAEELARHTLRHLVERLHPAVLDVVAAPRGLDVAISDPVILDPAEEAPSALPGAICLAVGVDTERARLTLLDRIATAGGAAVIFKAGGTPGPALLTAADEAGIALLHAPPALSWGQLYTLLMTAATATPSAEPDVPEVPLGDLFALANAIAAAVGGATTIEDPHNRVLAYSNLDHPIDPPRQATILGRQVPSEWIQRQHDAGVFRRLWQTDEVVRIADFIEDEEYLPRIAVAVRAGGELLGSIWVIEADRPLEAEASRALRDAADIAALHLLRHRTASDVDRQRRAAALLALLEGADRGDLARDVLGIEPNRPVAVVAFNVGAGTDAAALMAAGRVADLVAVYCESYRRQAACAAGGTRVYALVPVDPDARAEPLITLAEAIVDRARQALRLELRAGIGSVVPGLGGVVTSRREADEVLDVLADRGGRPIAAIDGVRSQVILHRLAQQARKHPELAAGRVAALAEQDATKGTAWVQTLRAYFDAFGDMAAAAAMVNVHPNTFRYRLRRITEVFGLDLADPDERLVAELQLRFQDPHP